MRDDGAPRPILTYYAGIAKRLGISPKEVRSLSCPVTTVVEGRRPTPTL
jgi:hypothetical protein